MGCAAIAGRLCAALMASFGAEGRRPAVALSTSQTVRRTSTLSRSFWHPAVARESRCSHGAVKPGFACTCGQVARPFAVGLRSQTGLTVNLQGFSIRTPKGWPLLQRRAANAGLAALSSVGAVTSGTTRAGRRRGPAGPKSGRPGVPGAGRVRKMPSQTTDSRRAAVGTALSPRGALACAAASSRRAPRALEDRRESSHNAQVSAMCCPA